MKALINCYVPFQLAHGGAQIQIEQTKAALEANGVTVEYLRWWDAAQTADVIQHFGRWEPGLIRLAQQKGIKVVLSEMLSAQGSRSPLRLALQRTMMRATRRAFPFVADRLSWNAYSVADAFIANTQWEGGIMIRMFGASAERVHILPNGVERDFFESPVVERGPWLVCTGTITERKRVLELAEAAIAAQAPVWIIGRPYSEGDPYYCRFRALAEAQPRWVRYEGGIDDRRQLAAAYRSARGFALLSTMETRSLSSEEAAASGCPLLLSDLPWARSVFGDAAHYCPVDGDTAACLRQFHSAAPTLPPPPLPLTWPQVGQRLRAIYEAICPTPS